MEFRRLRPDGRNVAKQTPVKSRRARSRAAPEPNSNLAVYLAAVKHIRRASFRSAPVPSLMRLAARQSTKESLRHVGRHCAVRGPANQENTMKMILKTAVAAAALCSATALIPTSAVAGVNVSVGIGLPGVVYGPGYTAYDDEYYYEPIYIGGAWYHGPYRWHMRHGERMFFVDGRWRRDEWRGVRPNSIMFRNG